MKLVVGAGTSLAGRLLMLDARSMEWTEIAVGRDPECVVCSIRRGAVAATADST